MSAPSAPIAPPSVGVAMPRKMVPSTRKISTSGGMSTKVTCSVRRDSSPILKNLLTSASTSASTDATVIDMMKISSPGAGSWRSISGLITLWCTLDQTTPATAQTANRTSSERWPLAPLGSR